jgi:hypothetical protein
MDEEKRVKGEIGNFTLILDHFNTVFDSDNDDTGHTYDHHMTSTKTRLAVLQHALQLTLRQGFLIPELGCPHVRLSSNTVPLVTSGEGQGIRQDQVRDDARRRDVQDTKENAHLLTDPKVRPSRSLRCTPP